MVRCILRYKTIKATGEPFGLRYCVSFERQTRNGDSPVSGFHLPFQVCNELCRCMCNEVVLLQSIVVSINLLEYLIIKSCIYLIIQISKIAGTVLLKRSIILYFFKKTEIRSLFLTLHTYVSSLSSVRLFHYNATLEKK